MDERLRKEIAEHADTQRKLNEAREDTTAADLLLQEAGRWIRHIPEANDLRTRIYARLTSDEVMYRLEMAHAVDEDDDE